MKERILLFYPPGPLFQRGEDRCQQNVDDGSAQAMRACNDLGYAAAVLLKKDYVVKLRDYPTGKPAGRSVRGSAPIFRAYRRRRRKGA